MNTKYTISLLLALTTMQAAGNTVSATDKKEDFVDRKVKTKAEYVSKLLSNRGKGADGKPIITEANFLTAAGGQNNELAPFDYSNHIVDLKAAVGKLKTNANLKKIPNRTSMNVVDLADILGANIQGNLDDVKTILADMGEATGNNQTKAVSATSGVVFDAMAALSASGNSFYRFKDTLQAIMEISAESKKIGATTDGNIYVSGLANPNQAGQQISGQISAKTIADAISTQLDMAVIRYVEAFNNQAFNAPVVLKAVQLQEILGQFRSILAAGVPGNTLFTTAQAYLGAGGQQSARADALIARYNDYLRAPIANNGKDAPAVALITALNNDVLNNGDNAPAVFSTGASVGVNITTDAQFRSMLIDGQARKLTANLDDIAAERELMKELKIKLASGAADRINESEISRQGSRLFGSADLTSYTTKMNEMFAQDVSLITEGAKDALLGQIDKIRKQIARAQSQLADGDKATVSGISVNQNQLDRLSKTFEEKSKKMTAALNAKFPSEAAKKDSDIKALTTEAGKINEDKVADFFEKIKNLSAAEQKPVVDATTETVKVKLNKMIEDKAAADKLAEETAAAKAKAEEKAKEEAAKKALTLKTLKDRGGIAKIASDQNEMNAFRADLKTITEDEKKEVLAVAHADVKAAVEAADKADAEKAAAEAKAAEAAKKPAAAPSKRKAAARRARGNAKRGQKVRGKAVKGKNPRRTKKITKRSNRKTAEIDSKDDKGNKKSSS